MAKVISGLGFVLSGKVGDMVYCKGPSGDTYARALPKIKSKPSKAQLACRLRMKMATNFLNLFRDLIMLAWKEKKYRKRAQPFSLALSHMIKNGIGGEYPELDIHYEAVLLSYGGLQSPSKPSVLQNERELLVTWEPKGIVGDEDSELVVALYHEELQGTLIYWERARRRDYSVLLELPEGLRKGKVHIYLLFLSHDGKDASKSVYAGLIHNP